MIHFLSDVHLSPRLAGVTRLFLDYLNSSARQAQALYILGDLFEAWIGDDDNDLYHQNICNALKAAANTGVSIFVQHGNRDFLLGSQFAANSSINLLPDPYLLELPEARFILSHGDALCTDDQEYQTFRHQVRTPQWQSTFLAKPLAERRAIATHLRQQSEDIKKCKDAALMDLNTQATEELMQRHGYATLIHGHTHQPASHTHHVNGYCIERWVLADWDENCGEILTWDGKSLRRQAIKSKAGQILPAGNYS